MNPLPNDPNGIPWEEYGYTSYEAFIESKAGANPPCTPGDCHCGGDKTGAFVDAWPEDMQPEYDPLIPASIWRDEDDSPPDAATENARRLVDEVEAVEAFMRAGPGNPYGKPPPESDQSVRNPDWPLPAKPPFAADDEDDEAPDE